MSIYSKDWFMMQVEQMVEFVARVVFGESYNEYQVEDYDNLTEEDKLFIGITALLNENKISEAEEYLFEKVDVENMKQFRVVLDFYQKLNNFRDEELEENNFSRERVFNGLKNISERFGIQSDYWLY